MPKKDLLLRVNNLKKYFPVKRGFFKKILHIKAVDDVSFNVSKGETLGIVGESGSGKSTLGLMILKLIKPTSGKIFFKNIEITGMNERKFRKFRRHMGVVFQDPSASLNPRMTVREILKRPLVIHGIKEGKEVDRRIIDILEKVGLGEEHLDRYPHEFSGGQQQRIAIARAIILNPELLVLDEPTSALDVSVQAQILNLLLKLQREFNLTYLFISHDLTVVRHMSDRIAVMYLGKIVELTDTDELFSNAMHPYTAALLSAVPLPVPEAREVKRLMVTGEPPSPINLPKGCRFRPRCIYFSEECKLQEPQLIEVKRNHFVACHRAGEIDVSNYVRELWTAIKEEISYLRK